jgi:hypothetical protein
MAIADMKKTLHDRLWNAQQRWFALRAEGATKHDLKLRGLRECGDPNRFTRNIIFAGSTRRSYEETLKTFVEFAHEKFGAQRLEDIGKQEFKAFIEDGVARGLAASTLEARCSHLSKLGALIGRSEQFFALARRTAGRIRELGRTAALAGPERVTPSPQIAARAIEILRSWDERHRARTGQPRAYHLAARLQIETAGRSVSVTDRLTQECLKEGNRVEIIGKGGRPVQAPVSADLYTAIAEHLGKAGEPLAARRGYQMAWRRAVQAVGGRAGGSHGLRRLSTRKFYRLRYAHRVEGGEAPGDARRTAREEAVERLGHSRNRADQAACYLDLAA